MGLINQLNATTEYFWLTKTPADILNKASALLWKLMGNAIQKDNWEVKPHEIIDGGLMVKVPLEYQNSNSGVYGATTVIAQGKVDLVDAARFPWAGLYASNTLNLNDLTQNTGDEAIIDLTKVYINNIIKSARVKMALDVIAVHATPDSIQGLGDLFNVDPAIEYGSISQNQMAEWKANVITTAEPMSFEVMQKIWRTPNMGEFAGFMPNFIVTTPLLRDSYERGLHPQQRYSDSKTVEAGWQNITHKGVPIVADPYVPVGVCYALNLNYLSLRSHKDYNFTAPKWVDKEVLGQPDMISANTRWRGNLYCSNRKMQVCHTGLTDLV